MTVELRHLRAFLAIVDEGNISRAAERLHLSQPALSRSLAQLERTLGTRLIERNTHRSEVTPEGRAFAAGARAAVAAFDRAVDAVRGAATPLRFGHSWGGALYASTIVRAWNREHPDSRVASRRSDDRWAGLANGDVDIALVRTTTLPPDVASAVITHEQRILAVPSTHRLARRAGRTSVSLDALVDERLVVNTVAGTTTLDLWPADRRPSIAADTATIDDWLVAIATGSGVGVTAASTAQLHPHPDVTFVAIDDAPPIPVVLAWSRSNTHPHVRSFVATARRAIR